MSYLRLDDLRSRHPSIIYNAFNYRVVTEDSVQGSSETGEIEIVYEFTLEPDIKFFPKLRLPFSKEYSSLELDNFVFHIGLIELISYYKTACPSRIDIRCAALNQKQTDFLRKLIKFGLGEFFFVNQLDPSMIDALEIISSGIHLDRVDYPDKSERALVLIAGGKDSSLVLELLSRERYNFVPLTLNQSLSAKRSVELIDSQINLLKAQRSIDHKLLDLNAQGYLNGHTPFSAVLSFIGITVAYLNGSDQVIVANEASANQKNANYRDLDVNHQYSKSFEYESDFRSYLAEFISPGINYFSLLRPVLDIQVAKFFCKFDRQLLSFRSCNVLQTKDSWCSKCPKCAFVYLTFAAFLNPQKLISIFASDLFQSPEILEHLRNLLGLGTHKPLECVGTTEESALALHLVCREWSKYGHDLPQQLQSYAHALNSQGQTLEKLLPLLNYWNDENFVPDDLSVLLRKYLLN